MLKDINWAQVNSWISSQGFKIAIILIIASLFRRFGMVILHKIISQSINHSERFENERDRKLRTATLVSLIGSILKIIVWAVATLLILGELGILKLLAPMLAGALAVGGVLSLMIGFGIQTFVKDFISGIFIVSENQYRVGDVVSLTASAGGAIEGAVTQITLRTTIIRDNDGTIHFVPNGNITRAANLTLDYAKVNLEVNVPSNVDFNSLKKAVDVMGQELQNDESWHKYLIQAPYYHGVQKFTQDHVVIEVRAKTVPAEQWRVASEIQERLVILLSKNKNFAESKKDSKKK